MSKAKTKVRRKKPSPIVIQYEMLGAEKYAAMLQSVSKYSYAKNHAVLRQVYKGTGANSLFCGSAVERQWVISFTTNAIDAETRLTNKKPHFISMEIAGKVPTSTAIKAASEIWLMNVKPEMDALNMLATRIDVVLRAKA